VERWRGGKVERGKGGRGMEKRRKTEGRKKENNVW
jgi:hypothetical protein